MTACDTCKRSVLKCDACDEYLGYGGRELGCEVVSVEGMPSPHTWDTAALDGLITLFPDDDWNRPQYAPVRAWSPYPDNNYERPSSGSRWL